MKVVDIDPEPGKGLCVFDGEADIVVPLEKAPAYVAGLAGVKDLLVNHPAATGMPPEGR